MKSVLLIITLLTCAFVSKAQVSAIDSVRHRSEVDSLKQKMDRLEDRLGVDSLKAKTAMLKRLSVGNPGDSLKIDSLSHLVSLQRRNLEMKIDSLKLKGLPHDRYSLQLDSLTKFSTVEKIDERVKLKVGKSPSQIDKLHEAATNSVSEKLAIVSKETGSKSNLPDQRPVDQLEIPSEVIVPSLPGRNLAIKDELPTIPSLDTNPEVATGKLDLPLLDNATDELPNTNIVPDPLNDIENKDLKIPTSLTSEKRMIEEKVGDLKEISGKGATNASVVKSAFTGDERAIGQIEKEVLDKAPIKKELKVLAEQEALIKKQKAEVAALKKKLYKEHTLARAKEMTAKHLQQFQGEIQSTIDKVNKQQARLGTVLAKTGDLPKRRDPLRQLKPRERLVPGVTFQIQKPGAWIVDVNPSLRYRMTSYWSAGAGWNERLLFGHYEKPSSEVRIFGIRSFSEVIIFKGFSFRLDAETMKAWDRMQDARHEDEREWIWNYIVGIKKDFSFMSRVTGNGQFMYNLYSTGNYAPYPTRFNVRFGFEYFPKKKTKK